MLYCQNFHVKIFRSKLNKAYFSKNFLFINPSGYERRLGGSMAIFANVLAGKHHGSFVIGSVHKVSSKFDEMKRYIGKQKIIVGGNQDKSYCNKLNFKRNMMPRLTHG